MSMKTANKIPLEQYSLNRTGEPQNHQGKSIAGELSLGSFQIYAHTQIVAVGLEHKQL